MSSIQLSEDPKVITPQQPLNASPAIMNSQQSLNASPAIMDTNHEDMPPNGSNDKKKIKHRDKKHKSEKKHRSSKKCKTIDDDDNLDPLWGPPCRRLPSPTPCRKFVIGQPFKDTIDLKKMGHYSQSFHKWYMAMSTTRTSRRQQATHFMVQYNELDFHHIKPGVFPVDFMEVFNLYNDQNIFISLHRSWILYMRQQEKYRSLVGFLDPEMMIKRRIDEEATAVVSYIVQALLDQQDKECIFAICEECNHWVLLAIFPKWNTVYTIDSMANPLGNSYSLMPLFDSAFLTYVEHKGRHNDALGGVVSWKSFNAHTQRFGENLCGQYVMRHMLSFTEQLSLMPNRYPQGRIGFATSPFLPEDIADVQERLLEFFMMEVVDIGGSCRVHGAIYN